ncbi:MAG: hypothetical protein H0X17_22090 [Deltaproteobacteria bacterium]|nr:hypothetical protein [Deltaproteobacteria bacterium]
MPLRDALSPLPDQPVRWLACVMGALTAIAIGGAIVILATAPGASARPGDDAARVASAREVAERYAFEAYPSWAAENFDRTCPVRLAELDDYAARRGSLAARDPWGTAYRLRCGPGVVGIHVGSAGPDGRFDTSDDVASK